MSYLDEPSLPSTLGMCHEMLNFLHGCNSPFTSLNGSYTRCFVTTCLEISSSCGSFAFLLFQNWIMMLFLSLTWRIVFLLTTKAWQTGKLKDFCEIKMTTQIM